MIKYQHSTWCNQYLGSTVDCRAVPDWPAVPCPPPELDQPTRTACADAARGVGVGDRVVILMLNRTEFIESLLAANKLGAIAVPVNFRMTAPKQSRSSMRYRVLRRAKCSRRNSGDASVREGMLTFAKIGLTQRFLRATGKAGPHMPRLLTVRGIIRPMRCTARLGSGTVLWSHSLPTSSERRNTL